MRRTSSGARAAPSRCRRRVARASGFHAPAVHDARWLALRGGLLARGSAAPQRDQGVLSTELTDSRHDARTAIGSLTSCCSTCDALWRGCEFRPISPRSALAPHPRDRRGWPARPSSTNRGLPARACSTRSCAITSRRSARRPPPSVMGKASRASWSTRSADYWHAAGSPEASQGSDVGTAASSGSSRSPAKADCAPRVEADA